MGLLSGYEFETSVICLWSLRVTVYLYTTSLVGEENKSRKEFFLYLWKKLLNTKKNGEITSKILDEDQLIEFIQLSFCIPISCFPLISI